MPRLFSTASRHRTDDLSARAGNDTEHVFVDFEHGSLAELRAQVDGLSARDVVSVLSGSRRDAVARRGLPTPG